MFLDFIKNRNASQQPPVAQTPQAQPTVESLPAHVKAAAVEVARPAAEIMGKGAQAQEAPANPTPNALPARGRSLSMER